MLIRTLRTASTLALFAPLAAAQGELVVNYGVPVPGGPGGNVSHCPVYGIADSGQWWAVAAAGSVSVPIVDGMAAFTPGTALADGSVVQNVGTVALTDQGDRLVHANATLPGTTLVRNSLIWNDEVIAREGMDVRRASGALMGTVSQILSARLDGNDRVLAQAYLAPVTLGGPRVLLEITPGPGIQDATLLLGGPVTYPDGWFCLDVESVEVNRLGQVLTAGMEMSPDFQTVLRRVRVDGVVRVQDDDPTPIPGRTWNFSSSFGSVFNTTIAMLDDAGEVTIASRTRGTSTGMVLARGSRLVAAQGQPIPGTSGPALQQFNPEGLAVLADGRVAWGGILAGVNGQRYFIDDQPFLEPGTPVAGSTVERVTRASGSRVQPHAGGGGFILQGVDLVDGRRGLLRLALPVGETTCTQTMPHSGGTTARLEARGANVPGSHVLTLEASDLPANRFGILAIGTSAANTPLVGSQGTLCLGGTVGRFNVVLNSGADGRFSLDVGVSELPVGGGVAARTGDTWHFQAWFRDVNPAPTSNLTDAVAVTFL